MLSDHQIKVIYAEGVEAVAAAFRRLYEMIETDDERVQKLIASATSAHLKRIEQLTLRVKRLEDELSQRAGQLHRLNRTIKELNRQLEEARRETRLAREAHLATVMKNSQTSSLPPSKDPHKKTRSLRQRSGKKPGGQVGHPGTTREFSAQPDRRVIYTPETCHLCGSSLVECEVKGIERRQVHDFPPLKVEVVEHQAQTKNTAKFLAGVKAPVQYGEGVRAVAAYLMGYQLLPYERCAEAISDLFNCQLSVGTLAAILKECGNEMSEPLLLIKEALRGSEVIGADETGLRVNQKQQWVHVSSTEKLMLLVHDKQRGAAATEKIGILPGYKGVCVHDGLSSYSQYTECQHGLCNAHILRELNYVIETSKTAWAQEMKQLLLEMKGAISAAVGAGKRRLAARQEKRFLGRYDRIVAEAGKLYSPLKRKKNGSKTRRPRESPITAAARKLVNRLVAKRDEILLFMRDFRVPFDNNQAERDLRMLKVKQKVSGCFRTEKGADEFCRIRSYVSTMKKQGHSVMETIKCVFAGKILMPTLRC